MPLTDAQRRAMFVNGGRNKKATLKKIDQGVKKLESDINIDTKLLKNLKQTKLELKKL